MAIQLYKVNAESGQFLGVGDPPAVRVYNVSAESGLFNTVVPGIRVYHLTADAKPLSNPIAWMDTTGTGTWVGYELWMDTTGTGTWTRYDI